MLLFVVLTLLVSSIYIPFVQNIITSKIETELGETLNADVSIQKIGLSFFADINIENIEITQKADTLLKLNKIVVDIELLPLFSNKVIIDELEVLGLNSDIYKLLPETDTTIVEEEPIDGESDNWEVIVNNISVSNLQPIC